MRKVSIFLLNVVLILSFITAGWPQKTFGSIYLTKANNNPAAVNSILLWSNDADFSRWFQQEDCDGRLEADFIKVVDEHPIYTQQDLNGDVNHDLNANIAHAPECSQSFTIYDNWINPNSNIVRFVDWIDKTNFYNKQYADEYALSWTSPDQYQFFNIEFLHDIDWADLASQGYAISLKLKADQYAIFQIRFENSTENGGIPWRLSYNLELEGGDTYQTITVPLATMVETGAWSEETWLDPETDEWNYGRWLDPRGHFSWDKIAYLKFSAEFADLPGIKIIFDEIKIVEPGAATSGKTFYVSANGTSIIGTSMDDPMSAEIAKGKTYQNNDRILFKSGDVFYVGWLTFLGTISDGNTLYIGSYGEGPKPIISGAKIVNSPDAWEYDGDGIWKIDLSDLANFAGIKDIEPRSWNIGFLEDSSGKKYYNRKSSRSEQAYNFRDDLTQEFDFYCNDTSDTTGPHTNEDPHLYMKIDENPYEKLGELILATETNLLSVGSNTVVDGLHLRHSGGRGIQNRMESVKNIIIRNCIIEDIGGSIHHPLLNGKAFVPSPRYGNGIEFWADTDLPPLDVETYVKDILIEGNLIRNIYDTGITPQGFGGYFKNITVRNNILIANPLSCELWADIKATGIYNFLYHDNLHINQGRGWGYSARPDKYVAGEINFGKKGPNATYDDINIRNNTYFNPLRLYHIIPVWSTEAEGLYGDGWYVPAIDTQNDVNADYNTMFLQNDVILMGLWTDWDEEKKHTPEQYGDIRGFDNFFYLQSKHRLEENSEAFLISDINEYSKEIEIATISLDFNEIKEAFSKFTGKTPKRETYTVTINSVVTGVTVNPPSVTVQKGTSYQFNATVNGTNDPIQAVTWTVEGGGAGTDITSGGALTISPDEMAATLIVKASSTLEGYTDISGTATVRMRHRLKPIS